LQQPGGTRVEVHVVPVLEVRRPVQVGVVEEVPAIGLLLGSAGHDVERGAPEERAQEAAIAEAEPHRPAPIGVDEVGEAIAVQVAEARVGLAVAELVGEELLGVVAPDLPDDLGDPVAGDIEQVVRGRLELLGGRVQVNGFGDVVRE
jgi:hypothetical protein